MSSFERNMRKYADTTARKLRTTKEITVETYQIKLRDHGKTLLLNRPAGCTLTLPLDTAFVGFTVEMIVRGTFSGTWEVTCQADGDLFFGGVTNTSIAAKADHFAPNGSSNDTWKADHNTKGRHMGSWLKFTLMGPNEWLVTGCVLSTGTPASAFADT
tara:strand:- start:87 stop:560 length:474 start_codon:yes stop_codon:yes gene_type:complete